MKCGGIHCDGCGHGPGGGLAAIVLLVLIIAAAARARHSLELGLEITGYVLMGIAAAGALAALGYGAWRVRRRVLEVQNRRISPQVRAVITDARAGRPVLDSAIRAGQLEPPPAWAPAQSWGLAGAARLPELAVRRSLLGDADREWLIAVLREHYADGRLSLDELSRRVAVVLTATYADQAADALTELPRIPRGAAAGER